jgi:transcriptional regulator with GAF, ATPase, and Fis domain
LWFRINLFPILIPPLRQRSEDIPALVAHFLDRKSKKLKIRTPPSPAPGVMDQLQAYDWPGNVRELENLVERALILSQSMDSGGLLHFNRFLTDKAAVQATGGMKVSPIVRLDEKIAAHIQAALDHAGGRVEGAGGAAQLLGKHPSTLRARMRKLGIPYGKTRNHVTG